MAKIIYVGGGKGGVGKSLVSMAVIDWLRVKGRGVTLVEGDGANPDVYKCYAKIIPAETCDFDSYDGWNALGDLIERNADEYIVVNSGARVIEGVTKFGHVLEDVARELGTGLDVLWPINRTRDSINALKDFRNTIASAKYGVIQNLFFGPPAKFTRWTTSPYAQQLVASGVKVAEMPEVSDRIADKLYDDRMTIEVVAATGSMVDRSNVTNWRKPTHAMLDMLIDD